MPHPRFRGALAATNPAPHTGFDSADDPDAGAHFWLMRHPAFVALLVCSNEFRGSPLQRNEHAGFSPDHHRQTGYQSYSCACGRINTYSPSGQWLGQPGSRTPCQRPPSPATAARVGMRQAIMRRQIVVPAQLSGRRPSTQGNLQRSSQLPRAARAAHRAKSARGALRHQPHPGQRHVM
jgi:hypothetical protein